MPRLELKLFGAFRDHFPDGKVAVEISGDIRVTELRLVLKRELARLAPALPLSLLDDTAIANESAVLDEAAVVSPGQTVALLPPVCGG